MNWPFLLRVLGVSAVLLVGGSLLANAIAKVFGYEIDWGDAAGWSQAVFSVAAIWAAGRFAIKDKLDRRAQSMEAFYGIAAEIRKAIVEAQSEAEASLVGLAPGRWNERFEDLEQMLTQVPVFELGATNGARMIASLRARVRGMHILMASGPGTASSAWIAAIRTHSSEMANHELEVNTWRKARAANASDWLWPRRKS